MYGIWDPTTNTTTHNPCTPGYYPPGYDCTKETQVGPGLAVGKLCSNVTLAFV